MLGCFGKRSKETNSLKLKKRPYAVAHAKSHDEVSQASYLPDVELSIRNFLSSEQGEFQTKKPPLSETSNGLVRKKDGYNVMHSAVELLNTTNVNENDAVKYSTFLQHARCGDLEGVVEYITSGRDINVESQNGLNALHLASKEGHLLVAEELIKRGILVDAVSKKGNTALHIASLAGQYEVVKLLVEAGADINCQSSNGFTALYMASQENHADIVEFLLGRGAQPNLSTFDGFTPLAVALQQKHEKVISLLLESNAKIKVKLPALHVSAKHDDVTNTLHLLKSKVDVNLQSASGFTALHIAAHYGNPNVAKVLVDNGAQVDLVAKNNITPLHVAAKWGRLEMVRKLLDWQAQVDSKTQDFLTPLHCAARSGHADTVEMLLNANANFSAKSRSGLSSLHMAAQGDHIEVARVLLLKGCNVDDMTSDLLTPLHVAAHCGHLQIAKLLLDRHCTINATARNGFTPLHIACKKNRLNVVQLLLHHGTNVNAINESSLSALHVAAFMGHAQIVSLLLEHGANVNQKNTRQETALHLATRNHQLEVVQILVHNDAEINANSHDDQTAFHIACRYGYADIVSVLLSKGAHLDGVTKEQYTALHMSSKEDHADVLRLLLDRGANTDMRSKKGLTPLHIAAKYGASRAAHVLLQFGASPNSPARNGFSPLHVAVYCNQVLLAQLLLENKADCHATTRNSYTTLHIAAEKNLIDMAKLLLKYGAKTSAESDRGLTALHLAAKEGHTAMCTLLLENAARPNHSSRSGAAALHFASLGDHVGVSQTLLNANADVNGSTKVGYTPLHTACYFGMLKSIRFLLAHGALVNAQTGQGFTPLHLAAQQGQLHVVYTLLEFGANPNLRNLQGYTAGHIAKKQHFVNLFQILEEITTVESWEIYEEIKVEKPDIIVESCLFDSLDEEDSATVPTMNGWDSDDDSFDNKKKTNLPQNQDTAKNVPTEPFSIRNSNDMLEEEMKYMSSQIGSISITSSTPSHLNRVNSVNQEEVVSAKTGHQLFAQSQHSRLESLPAQVRSKGFLVSFVVDSRGGVLHSTRHCGLRIVVPPKSVSGPTRMTCRAIKSDKLITPPQLNESEALACRIFEMSCTSASFNSPVILEFPHQASLRGLEREIIVLTRELNSELWKEHVWQATDAAVREALGPDFEPNIESQEELQKKRIFRILTNELPTYFALITRYRQENHLIGPEGGVIVSSVISQVKGVFPEQALQKKIRVGLQVHPIAPEYVSRKLGKRVAVSPIVSIEPRRRKFHKPMELSIPLPQPTSRVLMNSGESPTLRLLCSITGGTAAATWEDITGSTPLSFNNDTVSFTTTVSARFWLVDCPNTVESTGLADRLYQEIILIPFMAKFSLFAKRTSLEEAELRAFCSTDEAVSSEKTLEKQLGFQLQAISEDVEILLSGSPQCIKVGGNLLANDEQIKMNFLPLQENRVKFVVRLRDPYYEASGKIAFLNEPLSNNPLDHAAANILSVLNIVLPVWELPSTLQSKYMQSQEKQGLNSSDEMISRAELNLYEIAEQLNLDWPYLARELNISQKDISAVAQDYRNETERAYAMLLLWTKKLDVMAAAGNELEHALSSIGRSDVVKSCMKNIEIVTELNERIRAQEIIGSQDELVIPKNESVEESDSSRYNSTFEVFRPTSSENVFEEEIRLSSDDRRSNVNERTSLEDKTIKRRKEEGLRELLDALDTTDREDILTTDNHDDAIDFGIANEHLLIASRKPETQLNASVMVSLHESQAKNLKPFQQAIQSDDDDDDDVDDDDDYDDGREDHFKRLSVVMEVQEVVQSDSESQSETESATPQYKIRNLYCESSSTSMEPDHETSFLVEGCLDKMSDSVMNCYSSLHYNEEPTKAINHEIDQTTFGVSQKRPAAPVTSQYEDLFQRLDKANLCYSGAPEMELSDEGD